MQRTGGGAEMTGARVRSWPTLGDESVVFALAVGLAGVWAYGHGEEPSESLRHLYAVNALAAPLWGVVSRPPAARRGNTLRPGDDSSARPGVVPTRLARQASWTLGLWVATSVLFLQWDGLVAHASTWVALFCSLLVLGGLPLTLEARVGFPRAQLLVLALATLTAVGVLGLSVLDPPPWPVRLWSHTAGKMGVAGGLLVVYGVSWAMVDEPRARPGSGALMIRAGEPWPIVRLVDSPLRFFRSRLRHPPRWPLASAAVIAHTVLVAATVLVVTRKGRLATTPGLTALGVEGRIPPLVGDVIGVVSVVTANLAVFALTTLVLVGSDALFSQSGRARRLVEFAGLAYVTQLPWGIGALAVSLWVWDPEPFRVSPGVSAVELPDLLRRHQESMAAAPVQSTLRVIGAYFTVWLVALQCAALRVVSGVSGSTAWGVGLVLVLLLVVMPYAWSR